MNNNIENIEDFYKHKFNSLPLTFANELGHFNVFKRGPSKIKSIKFGRRDFFKISLLKGKIKINYLEKSIISDKYVLLISDPLVPYSWETLEDSLGGAYCIFSKDFFFDFVDIRKYPLFKLDAKKAFLLNEQNVIDIENIYEKMFKEIESIYIYKYDVLRNLVLELIHYVMKLDLNSLIHKDIDTNITITTKFNEILQRQFPIESPYQRVELKTPSDFSNVLNIHTNHLNKTLKTTTGRTTSELIATRFAQEATALLKHTSWTISDIAYALKFEETSHFINFFKKHFNQTPKKFRDLIK
ncbi:AraC family transcriptional regulator [Malaciobacter molluscorum LMG 25693]|uniref:AraC family transcriptional regulator n=1 Tax=Malaciobacter molluscorum LMG 25693 TaxID=870501 RepID=A0A2G1DGV6_9BACT|nr:helix-turn-helix transcriptional regulator [Malaciobacter molluscorum]AXX92276.1 transcriptional regulator, AraC family [Malaciobacter molluscorum LMG 25693]PHO17739.1 AraC family transcriptional regulator [Malaciobacter molluscorum LMG 25693]